MKKALLWCMALLFFTSPVFSKDQPEDEEKKLIKRKVIILNEIVQFLVEHRFPIFN